MLPNFDKTTVNFYKVLDVSLWKIPIKICQPE